MVSAAPFSVKDQPVRTKPSRTAAFYEFRYKETDIYEPSPATELEVRALTPQAKKLTIDKNIVHGRVTAVRDAVNPGDKVTLTVSVLGEGPAGEDKAVTDGGSQGDRGVLHGKRAVGHARLVLRVDGKQ